jgi:hypothetical protein
VPVGIVFTELSGNVILISVIQFRHQPWNGYTLVIFEISLQKSQENYEEK